MPSYRTPGVYKEEIFVPAAAELRTGVPAFLGYAGEEASIAVNTPQEFTLWPQFKEHFGVQETPGKPLSDRYLAYAVRGFFQNGGDLCYVVRLKEDKKLSPADALGEGLDALAPLEDIDLICAPDIIQLRQEDELPLDTLNPIWRPYVERLLDQWERSLDPDKVLSMQAAVLKHCDNLGDRFAVLDSLPGADLNEILEQRQALRGTNGALYCPWVKVADGPASTDGFVPPCGHLTGVYARSDRRVGVHKAPANEVLEGVLDLKVNLTDADQESLNPEGVNCLRAFPGRGIRVWGARTLSDDPAWTYVSVRRLFTTAGRWIERNLAEATFEPNDARLWARIGRELSVYFAELFRRGALKGRTAEEAFYVKCDDETNPPEVREAGRVVTEIGLAPAIPSEFVVVHIIHGASGVTIVGPTRPESRIKEV